MPIEAVPYKIPDKANSDTPAKLMNARLEQAAREINELLSTGTYVGHIAVESLSGVVEGIILLLNKP